MTNVADSEHASCDNWQENVAGGQTRLCHMRVSVPTIPHALSPSLQPRISPAEAVDRIAEFLAPGNVALLTGAGVSVDSGVKAYRGKDGRYMNPNYKPIFYHELVDESPRGQAFRKRYWLRSYIGYPPIRHTQPNTTHFAIAALQHSSVVTNIVTQNVDGLHHKAIHRVWDKERMHERILELHGTLFDWLSAANPQWKEYMDDLERNGNKPQTNPDGDVALEGVSYDDYVVPKCPSCLNEGRHNNIVSLAFDSPAAAPHTVNKMKPDVIFFGESIGAEVKDRRLSEGTSEQDEGAQERAEENREPSEMQQSGSAAQNTIVTGAYSSPRKNILVINHRDIREESPEVNSVTHLSTFCSRPPRQSVAARFRAQTQRYKPRDLSPKREHPFRRMQKLALESSSQKHGVLQKKQQQMLGGWELRQAEGTSGQVRELTSNKKGVDGLKRHAQERRDERNHSQKSRDKMDEASQGRET
ncbi:hypothetical protein EVG20_g3189 [Dentipellis fragilis]|uniref:Deacetylase sirtuin-type domain-containing protein n=1 Tax=Dentipellis fragilis TaxID=205917 RepID=A0A4Y9Z6B2_9AGAM|nr:hypothetical protein EVG20_g3189 [Dentipellis fragilis]